MLSDREAADRGLEMLAWIKASAEGDRTGATAMAPSGLDDDMAARWGGVAVLTVLGLYARGMNDPRKTVSAAFDELRANWVHFREHPPDEAK